ncbi:hypothetical protein NDK50_31290 [Paraburkholderia bryophila]|uniref:hypothetical protein n=1 Tax=Paraburkholderia bryophila TaxID=420952 RepID=UPI00234AEE2D|nr:hypothetical protein [Paraburkholderia bryophila]WCM22498.1 hypothetical protein NDK50_31290 [Paraburkholderia bryophila]
MRAESRFIFFPGNNAPRLVRVAAAVYWIVFLEFVFRIVVGVGVAPFGTHQQVETALTLFGLLAAMTISYAFTIMRLSAGKLWARNVALVLTAFLIATTLYHLASGALSFGRNDIVGLIIVVAETVAGIFLLTSESTTWFKSKVR